MGVFEIGFGATGERGAIKMDLDPARPNEAYILEHLNRGQSYEPDVANALLRFVEPGAVVVDVGANVGYFTLMAARLTGPTGHVVSFEPGDNNLHRLEHNIAINKFQQVALIEQPAVDTPGDVTFYLNADDSGGNALWNPATLEKNVMSVASPKPLTMRGTTVDAEIARLGLPTPRVIKVDTEGAELTVLKGCRNQLANCGVPFVITEFHPFGLRQMGASPRDLRAFMASFGYSTFFLYYDGAMPRFVPLESEIGSPSLINLLFSPPENVGRIWPNAWHDPGSRTAQPGQPSA